jgi:hypothetical protein
VRSAKPQAAQVAGEGEPTNSARAVNKPLSGLDRSERRILGVLLAEPQRWHDVQQSVHPADFSDALRRKLAELYWGHQRDEGEPVFNEFLGQLAEPDLKELAVEIVEETEEFSDLADTLKDAVLHLEQERRRQEERKLVAQFRRTDGETDEQDQVAKLKKLQEMARQPDLRRVGS